jgi:hypothetical protein
LPALGATAATTPNVASAVATAHRELGFASQDWRNEKEGDARAAGFVDRCKSRQVKQERQSARCGAKER